MQIRSKLTLQFITIVAGILALALCFIYWKFREMTVCEFYEGLRSKALMTAEMVLRDEENMKPLAVEASAEAVALPFNENVTIYNDRLQPVFSFNASKAAPPVNGSDWLAQRQEHRFQRARFHALAVPHTSRSGKKYLVVAESVFDPSELIVLRNILLISFLFAVGIVAAGGWFFAGQALAPVSRIMDQVEGMLPSDLSARLKFSNNRDELSRLAFTINRLLDRIEFAFRMQKSFISNVSHELKNPLSVIISQLEVTLHKPRTEEEYRTALRSVLEDSNELADVTEKLLQLARVHSDGNQIALERLRLDEIMLQTRTALLRLHPDYHIAFDIDGLPEEEEQLCVLANEPLLRSALLNLMDNGCKFSPDKRVMVKVKFDANGRHQVEITDHGPGIPQKDLQMIFQPFYRSSQSIHVRGSGIGLSLVDSILKLHRVAMNVVSEPGKGTTFRLYFPSTAT